MDWFDGGSSVLKRGEYGMVYDIQSGVFFNIKRMGGTNHADIEPATLEDTAKLYSICGGEYSWIPSGDPDCRRKVRRLCDEHHAPWR